MNRTPVNSVLNEPIGGGAGCPSCGAASAQVAVAAPRGWVYAIGRIAPKFPDLGVEKEFAQLGASATPGLLEMNRLIDVLKDPGSAYLARQLCWVFHNGETEAFSLACRDDADAAKLIDALPRAERADQTIQAVVGSMGFVPGDAPCVGAALPSVTIDHHLTFQMPDFIDALSVARHGAGEKEGKERVRKADETFRAAARDLFARLTRRSDNRGLSDEHRALNYLALRYPEMYRLVADAQRDDKALIDVQVRSGPSASRRLVAVRPMFRARRTDVIERYQCLVDVTDRFPFLASSLAPVYD